MAKISPPRPPSPEFEEPGPERAMRVLLAGGSAEIADYRRLTHDASRIVVSDGTNVFVVPIGADASIEPMRVAKPGLGLVCP